VVDFEKSQPLLSHKFHVRGWLVIVRTSLKVVVVANPI
jgi:hypothetical protein